MHLRVAANRQVKCGSFSIKRIISSLNYKHISINTDLWRSQDILHRYNLRSLLFPGKLRYKVGLVHFLNQMTIEEFEAFCSI